MGLLDDAIKEHLDLKRRRGADPTEVERLEREALGPVRRAQHEPADLPTEQPETASSVAYPDDEETEHEWTDAANEESVFDHDPEQEFEREPPRHHEIAQEWDSHEPLDLQEPPAPAPAYESPAEDPFPVEPPPPAAATPRPSEAAPPVPAPAEDEHLDQETAEYDIEAEQRKNPDGEDVLEETPEFLQDTPDHDRLWFEQRPPRDFDFDG
ncbi:MAG TPA: hypothetical protein VMP89_13785 [Solirubrobacteraceae bacterium]|nr:hypothetical protein [Solirubrobacteraceae bacterium]